MPTMPHARPAAAPSKRAGKRVAPAKPATGGDKRAPIMTAALELFVERGFFGTAVPEIAQRAGVGAGTIYRYFPSKEALVNEVYREHKLAFARRALDDFPVTAPTREQFRVLWMRMAKFATEHASPFVFLELHHHASYLDAESREVEQRIAMLFGRVITTAQARGELKPGDPGVIMGLMRGAFVGVIRSCAHGDRAPGEADWKFAEQCMWEAVRA